MKFIRIFWGDLEVFDSKFKTQITNAAQDIQDNEVVMVWGEENNKFLKDLGYTTYLISNNPWKEEFGMGHHMFNHTSLLHKLYAFNIAVVNFGEVLFLDWDCYKIKEYDKTFYATIRQGNELQVPLYVYPKQALDRLAKSDIDIEYFSFFSKLADYLEEYAYKLDDDFIIPNTGFIYCNNKTITEKLLDLAITNNLQTVPDELAVLFYAKELELDLDGFIAKFEPSVINGKFQDNPEWIESQNKLDEYIKAKVDKNIFFHHV